MRLAPDAELWASRTSAHILAAFPELESRIHVAEEHLGEWRRPDGRDGEPLPYRIAPLPIVHAPHLWGIRYSHGEVEEDWTSWEDRRLYSMRDGQTLSYMIDLYDEHDRVVFRIHLLESATDASDIDIPAAWIEKREVDLSVLCVPAHWKVSGYPHTMLADTRSKYAVGIHYENFFAPYEAPVRFIRSLTDARFEGFLDAVEYGLQGREPLEPVAEICGPRGDGWATPLPGERLGFRVPPASAVLDSTP